MGTVEADEVVQLYVRDLVASVTRPVKELKDFKRVRLMPGESRQINFTLSTAQMGFFDKNGNYLTEPGKFQIWTGGNSDATLHQFVTIK